MTKRVSILNYLGIKPLLVASFMAVTYFGASTTNSNAQSMRIVHVGPAIGTLLTFGLNFGTRLIQNAADRVEFAHAMKSCTDAIIYNRRDFRVGYRCNPNRDAIRKCTSGRPGYFFITHIQRQAQNRFVVFWRAAGQCRERYGDCSSAHETGHCTDRVRYHSGTEATVRINLSNRYRNNNAVGRVRYTRR